MKLIAALSFVAFSILSSVSAAAIAPTYLNIVGTVTGTFTTSDVSKAGAIVSSFAWGVVSPRDASTGMATGKRRYDSLVITRVPSAMSIQLLTAISRNELLKTVVLTTTVNNMPKKITLSNANIISYTESFDATNGPMESFTITYSRIEEEMNKFFFVDDVSMTSGAAPSAVPSAIPMPSPILL